MSGKRTIVVLLIMTLLLGVLPFVALAGKADVVSFGADLTSKQQGEILKEFGVSEDEVNIIKVTIQDVKDHLEGIATDKQIGTNAISSAYVKLLPEGQGLQIDIHNITWVSNEMYANALVTAGVEDAEVKVAAPFNVTGTTALTGIMKAFEEAIGQKLTEEAKKTANEELVLTGDIGQEIGKNDATKLIQDVKNQVIKQKIKSPEDIRNVINDIANQLDIKLSEEQINQILKLMEKISTLDLNVDKISKQLDKISNNLDIVKKTIDDNRGAIQKILDAISSWLKAIFG